MYFPLIHARRLFSFPFSPSLSTTPVAFKYLRKVWNEGVKMCSFVSPLPSTIGPCPLKGRHQNHTSTPVLANISSTGNFLDLQLLEQRQWWFSYFWKNTVSCLISKDSNTTTDCKCEIVVLYVYILRSPSKAEQRITSSLGYVPSARLLWLVRTYVSDWFCINISLVFEQDWTLAIRFQ